MQMEISLSGNVRDTSLARILVSLNRNRKTGTLSVRTPAFVKKVYLNTGDVVFASSTYEDDRLGEMLLKANKITVEQYDKSVEILKSSRKRQGAILVELGFITPKELFWGVKYQVKEIIYSMFQIEDGEYVFEEGNIPTGEVITLKMSMGNLIYEGIGRIENWTRIRNELPDTESVLTLSDDPLSLFRNIELTPQDKKIISMIAAKKTLGDIIENSLMGSFEVLKITYVLYSLGMVKEAEPEQPGAAGAKKEGGSEVGVSVNDVLQPPSGEEASFLGRINSLYARLADMDPYELLEVDRNAEGETVRKNYYRLAKEFHPDRYFTITDESVKSKLAAVFDAVSKAYESLKEDEEGEEIHRPPSVAAEDKSDRKAEGQFERGVGEFKKGNFRAAIDNFKQAAGLMPGNSRYWSYLSLACSRVAGRLRDAEEALLTAITLEPTNADYHANLGLIYLKAAEKKKARSSFEKALRIDPGNEKARKGLVHTGK
jgi:predicted negative regulator of RcsB-dependent stress response